MAVGAIVLSAMSASLSQAAAIEIKQPKGVVELFTSQGCSSCPAADRALSELNAEGQILGLSLHVDYWDRLGWKDTFASPAFTKRQWAYARALGERQVYTPQAIINGKTHLVGSRKEQIKAMIAEYHDTSQGLTVPVNVTRRNGALEISVSPGDNAKNATLYVYYFTPGKSVDIKRGENTGKTIEYSNVVGKVDMIGMIGDSELATTFSINELKRKGYPGCALILQAATPEGDPGRILGATVITDL